jgi:hypothetical protein
MDIPSSLRERRISSCATSVAFSLDVSRDSPVAPSELPAISNPSPTALQRSKGAAR